MSEQPEQHKHRRSTDPGSGAWYLHKRLDDCESNVSEIRKDLKELKQHAERMAEIMGVWNNAKGFWAVMRFMSAFAKVMMFVGGLAAAIWIFLKTGHWMKWDE